MNNRFRKIALNIGIKLKKLSAILFHVFFFQYFFIQDWLYRPYSVDGTINHPIKPLQAQDIRRMLSKFLHITLAISMLFSTAGVTLFEHLCQMKGRTASVFIKANPCCQKKIASESSCHKKNCCPKSTKSSEKGITPKPCCSDKAQYFKTNLDGTTFKTFSTPDFKFQHTIVESMFFTGRFGIIPLNQKILRFYLYKPPPKATDIRVLVQSFLC